MHRVQNVRVAWLSAQCVSLGFVRWVLGPAELPAAAAAGHVPMLGCMPGCTNNGKCFDADSSQCWPIRQRSACPEVSTAGSCKDSQQQCASHGMLPKAGIPGQGRPAADLLPGQRQQYCCRRSGVQEPQHSAQGWWQPVRGACSAVLGERERAQSGRWLVEWQLAAQHEGPGLHIQLQSVLRMRF